MQHRSLAADKLGNSEVVQQQRRAAAELSISELVQQCSCMTEESCIGGAWRQWSSTAELYSRDVSPQSITITQSLAQISRENPLEKVALL